MGGAAAGAGSPTFTAIFNNIFLPKCAACHGAGLLTLTDKMSAYTGLVMMGAQMDCAGLYRVLPGMPEMSVLIMAFRAEGCRMTGRMPPSGNPLSEAEIQQVIAWIQAGAKND